LLACRDGGRNKTGNTHASRHLSIFLDFLDAGRMMANVCYRDREELHAHVIRARECLRHKREVIRACSRQCGFVA
jgi:hypothetical protein